MSRLLIACWKTLRGRPEPQKNAPQRENFSPPVAAAHPKHHPRKDGEGPVHFEIAPKCLKYRHPFLRGPICGTSDLRVYGVPYCTYERLAPKFQTHAPSFEVNGPLAVPAVSWKECVARSLCQRPDFARQEAAAASSGCSRVRPLRRHHQQSIRDAFHVLSDSCNMQPALKQKLVY